MNRRQEVATWVFGLVLVAVSAYQGESDGDWFFGLFVPVLILGLLTLFSLRTRGTGNGSSARSFTVGIALVAVVAAFAHLRTRAGNVEDRLLSEVASARGTAEEARSAVEELERKADELDAKIDYLSLAGR